MHITILGTGAMACLLGSRLAAVAEVALVGTWPEALAAIAAHGILLQDGTGFTSTRVTAARLGEPVEPADLVLVLVKTWQTARVAPHLDRLRKINGEVLTLQNGLGNQDVLGSRALLGVTTLGATLLAPGKVRLGGSGPTYIAGPAWIVDLFRAAGLEAHQIGTEEAEGLVWAKLTVNCGINALTALLGVPNGELLARPPASALMERAAAECSAVARARSVALPFEDPVSEVRRVARQTGGNISSMLQDVRRGAPTECDAINGAVAREGRRLNVPTPVNDVLWHLVKALEASDAHHESFPRRNTE